MVFIYKTRWNRITQHITYTPKECLLEKLLGSFRYLKTFIKHPALGVLDIEVRLPPGASLLRAALQVFGAHDGTSAWGCRNRVIWFLFGGVGSKLVGVTCSFFFFLGGGGLGCLIIRFGFCFVLFYTALWNWFENVFSCFRMFLDAFYYLFEVISDASFTFSDVQSSALWGQREQEAPSQGASAQHGRRWEIAVTKFHRSISHVGHDLNRFPCFILILISFQYSVFSREVLFPCSFDLLIEKSVFKQPFEKKKNGFQTFPNSWLDHQAWIFDESLGFL